MLKINKLMDYGLLIVVTMAQQYPNSCNATKISKVTKLSMPTVRKLLNKLIVANIITSKRGIEGGYTLVNNPQNITVLDIVKCIEKDVNLTECCDLQKKCSLGNCKVTGYWRSLNNQLLELLSKTSIHDIVNNNL